MQARANVLVSGLVQGVGFRYFVFNRATNSGLVGFVRNLYSGEVELEVEGDRSVIEDFIKEVRTGPRAAKVTGFNVEWIATTGKDKQFEVR